MHLQPSRESLVVAGREMHIVACCHLCNRLTGLSIPDSRVCHTNNLLILQPSMFCLNAVDLAEHLVRCPLHTFVGSLGASIQLQYAVGNTVCIDSPPAAGEGLCVAPVEAAVDLPVVRDLKWINDMGEGSVLVMLRSIHKVLKELTLEDIPATMEPRLTQFGRQRLQFGHILRVGLHHGLVVLHQSLCEAVVLRNLFIIILPCDEQTLDVVVTHAAWVAGVVGSLGQSVGLTHSKVDLLDPLFLELRSLIYEDDIILSALILVQVTVIGTVAKPDGAAIGEGEHLVRLVISRHLTRNHSLQWHDVVVDKLSVCPTHDQDLDARPAHT